MTAIKYSGIQGCSGVLEASVACASTHVLLLQQTTISLFFGSRHRTGADSILAPVLDRVVCQLWLRQVIGGITGVVTIPHWERPGSLVLETETCNGKTSTVFEQPQQHSFQPALRLLKQVAMAPKADPKTDPQLLRCCCA